MESIDMKLICRLCAKEDRFCIEVFGDDGNKNNISKKVRLCLPITIKEDDEYPKQVCLSCLNKLDTSYELYSGCMNAQTTIKKLVALQKNLCRTDEPRNVAVEVETPVQQTNFIAQQHSSLSSSNPVMRIGKTVVSLQNSSSDLQNSESEQPRRKIRRLESDSDDDDNDGNDGSNAADDDISTRSPSPLESAPLEDKENCSESVRTNQQVPQLENTRTVAADALPLVYVADNVGSATLLNQQLGTSSVSAVSGLNVGNSPVTNTSSFLGTVQAITNPGNQLQPVSLSSVFASALSSFNGQPGQYVMASSSINPSVPLVIQQITAPSQTVQSGLIVPIAHTSPTVTKVTTSTVSTSANVLEKQQDSFMHSLLKTQKNQQLHLKIQVPQQISAQTQTGMKQQFSTADEVSVPSLVAKPTGQVRPNTVTSSGRQKDSRNILPVPSVRKNSASSAIVTTSMNVLTCSPSSVAGLTVPPLVVSSRIPQVYVKNNLQNSAAAGGLQLAGQQQSSASVHPSTCVCHKCLQLKMTSPATTTTTTSSVLYTTLSGSRTITTSTNIRPTTMNKGKFPASVSNIVTSCEPTSVSMTLSSNSSVDVNSMGMPKIASVSSIGSMNSLPDTLGTFIPVSVADINNVNSVATFTVANSSSVKTSTVNTVTTMSSSVKTTGTLSTTTTTSLQPSGSNNTYENDLACTEALPTDLETNEDTTTSLTSVSTSNSLSSATTITPSDRATEILDVNYPAKNSQGYHLCPYCNKYFPESIIVHHKTLHFRERFFCCISCGKNFRTEVGLESHRCDAE
ncbi:serine-rich adhesin for platelets-like [Periplaneta americana]|uniref:serine-rich adhesin for platelets-like n=1 Tax=Periplaneta americana TaxID=6978 RepID=UPI0037E74A56